MTYITINEIVCVGTSPYYLEWFEKYKPNVPINRYDGKFLLQCMHVILGGKSEGHQWIIFLDEVVTVIKYKNIPIANISTLNYYHMVLSPILQYLLMMF